MNQLAPVNQAQAKPVPVKQDIARLAPDLQAALPEHIPVERFIRTAQTAVAMNPKLAEANRQSLYAACVKAATDGLILDGKEAALVIGSDGKVQYRPMIQGIRKLAYQTGFVKDWTDRIVYEGDAFEYIMGDDEKIIHKPLLTGDAGQPVGVYAIVRLINGGVQREFMSAAKVNVIRDRSDGYKAFLAKRIKSNPWHTDWEEMARKTVSRRISKSLPRSSDEKANAFFRAVERDDEDFDFSGSDDMPANGAVEPQRKARGGAASALKDITPKGGQVIDKTEAHDRRQAEQVRQEPAQGRQEAKPQPAKDQPRQAQAKPQARQQTEDRHPFDPETGEVFDYQDDTQGGYGESAYDANDTDPI